MTKHWTDALLKLDACADAVKWAKDFDTPDAAWRACRRGDWMLWLAGTMAGKPGSKRRKTLVLAACGCARLVRKHILKREDRPRLAIETAERWTRGEATLLEVRKAADAATYTVAHAAAYAAADAAYSTYSAAHAAAAAAHYSAHAATIAADAARFDTLARCADIVRRFYPKCPLPGKGE